MAGFRGERFHFFFEAGPLLPPKEMMSAWHRLSALGWDGVWSTAACQVSDAMGADPKPRHGPRQPGVVVGIPSFTEVFSVDVDSTGRCM